MLIFQLSLLSCSLHDRHVFRVIPGNPSYVLRSPDSHTTPLPDVLREYNAFVPGSNWIDLRPLMELRIENAYYEKGSSRKGLQGFLGTEVAHYEITAKGLVLRSVQHMANRPSGDLPVQELIAPSIQRAHYYRFYFEIVFDSSKNTVGSVLLSANSKNELELLATQLDHPEALCGASSNHCTEFPDACSVSVEMKLVVNGKSDVLVWGSLLKSVTGPNPHQVAVRRLYRGRLIPVKINVDDPASLNLPLLPGDRIAWN